MEHGREVFEDRNNFKDMKLPHAGPVQFIFISHTCVCFNGVDWKTSQRYKRLKTVIVDLSYISVSDRVLFVAKEGEVLMEFIHRLRTFLVV